MPWVRIDEEFARHPKVVAAGPLGMAMQVAALCYCNQYLTDGFVPRSVAAGLIDFEGIGMRQWMGELFGGGEDATWKLVVEDLLEAGLWIEEKGGYRIHDYHDYQPSREAALKLREDRSAAGHKGGKASAKARGQASASANAQAKSNPVPVPVPPTTGVQVIPEDEPLGVVTHVEQTRPVGIHPATVQQVFDAWQHSTGKHKARLDDKRRRKIQQALKTYPLEDILDAVQGWRNSPHHCGQNDRGTVYNDLELLLRDAKHIEAFRDLARDGPGVPIGKRTQQLLNHQQGMHAVGMAKGVIGNGNGLAPMGALGRPDQRELARPADRTADSG
jgi:hypothetical protein